MTKILLISGSPRDGNTDFILSKIFESLEGDKELICLRDKNIRHCIGCMSCNNKPECITNDDMSEVLQKMTEADVIVIGTPNYFDNVSGLMKDFIDRCHPFYKSGTMKNKKLILIMVGGGKVEGSEKYLACTTYGFVKYLGFDLVGSYCFRANDPDELQQNPEALPEINKIIEKIRTL